MKPLKELLLFGVVVTLLFALTRGYTNPSDTAVLQNLFTSFNSPSQQLLGWNGFGSADPCGGSWKGITCSVSAVTEIDLSNLGLTGSLGYMLDQLLYLTKMDVSGNHISGNIPYQLPPNLQILNFASNDLSGGNLPYSISSMRSLRYLNVGHNQLSASIADVFQNLGHLSTLDMSFNLLTGSLPQSFASLSNISILYLQNNQLSGTLSILNDLTLQDINVENNQFTGWVPSNFLTIPHASYGGNNFNNSPAPPPPPYTPPPQKGGSGSPTSSPARIPKSDASSKDTESGRGTVLNGGAIAGIVIAGFLGAIVVVLLGLYFCWKVCADHRDVEKQQSAATTFRPATPPIIKVGKERSDPKSKYSVADVALKLPPVESHKVVADKSNGKISASKRSKSPISATTYSVADLQIATNSFSQENLVGEGALGRVYRAEMPTGKVLAVKKMDSSASSVQKDEEFTEIVSKISRLRHSNIAELVGYCTEHGQRLLIYDYFGKGTLHDLLYSPDDSTKRELSWNVRVKIALGTARGLEYLHEVCLPAVVHKNCKSANILLDEELNPHLSDCGIAAFSPSPERQVSTQMMGSFGYSAPEYAMSGIYTAKSDVYSFGVVMLELLTGRKPLDSSRPRSEQSLVRWATPQLHDIDSLAKMVDLALKGMYPVKSLSRFADIIALCVQPEPEFRPPMSEVVQLLVRLMQRATPSKRRSSESADVRDPSELSLQGAL